MDTSMTPMTSSSHLIGIVKGYEASTRRLKVYIPKFMPAIPEDQEDQTGMTNYGGNTISSSISYASQITTISYVWAYPKIYTEKLPKEGSRVALFYLEGNPERLFWEPFDPNGLYEVIDQEKYDKLATLHLGNKYADIYEDDVLTINLPANFKSTTLKKNKNITANIMYDDPNPEKIDRLDGVIGNSTYTYYDYFNAQSVTVKAKGLIRRIEELENTVGDDGNGESFSEVVISSSKDPSALGLYEYDLSSEKYVKTSDISPGYTEYILNNPMLYELYEENNGVYSLTSDSWFEASASSDGTITYKTYYELSNDTYVESSMKSESPADLGLYELNENGSFVASTDTYIVEESSNTPKAYYSYNADKPYYKISYSTASGILKELSDIKEAENIILSNDIVTEVDVGNIKSGTTLSAGTSIQSILEKIFMAS